MKSAEGVIALDCQLLPKVGETKFPCFRGCADFFLSYVAAKEVEHWRQGRRRSVLRLNWWWQPGSGVIAELGLGRVIAIASERVSVCAIARAATITSAACSGHRRSKCWSTATAGTARQLQYQLQGHPYSHKFIPVYELLSTNLGVVVDVVDPRR